MPCPVCDGTEHTEINVRMKKDSDLSQVVGSPWDGRNVARCDDCGVLYDHQLDERQGDVGQVNCPDCGSLNPGDRDRCEYCDADLDRSAAR